MHPCPKSGIPLSSTISDLVQSTAVLILVDRTNLSASFQVGPHAVRQFHVESIGNLSRQSEYHNYKIGRKECHTTHDEFPDSSMCINTVHDGLSLRVEESDGISLSVQHLSTLSTPVVNASTSKYFSKDSCTTLLWMLMWKLRAMKVISCVPGVRIWN